MAREELEDAATGRPYPPKPPNEEERLKVSAAIFPEGGLGDGAPEDAMLQSMCKTICKLFNVPIAGKPFSRNCTYIVGLSKHYRPHSHKTIYLGAEDNTLKHSFSQATGIENQS